MMTSLFRLILFVGVLFYFVIIMLLMRKGKMNLKYSLVWLITGILLLLCDIFPNLIRGIADLLGVYSEVNVVFFVGVCFLIIIILSLTSIVSLQTERVRNLTQTQAMLEKRVRELEEIISKDEKAGE